MDHDKLVAACGMILEAIGEDPQREGLRETPERMARMYEEVFAGLENQPMERMKTIFSEDYDEIVVVKDIPFFSMCEHHLLPFFGVAHVAYIPQKGGMITGLSKLTRLVEGYSRRLQVQERLTSQVASAIQRTLDPQGTLVVIEAEHLCMSMRGVRKPGAVTVTSAVHGVFRDEVSTRLEAMRFIEGHRH